MAAAARVPASIRQASQEFDRFLMERSQKEVRSPTAVAVRPPALLRAPNVMQATKRVHPVAHTPAQAERPIVTPPEQPQKLTLDKMRLLSALKENEKLRRRVDQLVVENANWKAQYEKLEKRLKELEVIYDG